MASLLKVIIADDDVIVRAGIEGLLGTFDDVEIVASCASLPELSAVVDQTPADVVLTDIRMPPSYTDEGIRVAQLMRDTHPDVGVVVLSQFVDPDLAFAVLQDGSRGRGYLLKEHVADGDYLLTALRCVAAGGSFIDADVLDALVAARSSSTETAVDRLTSREAEVLAELAAGHSNAAIAEHLFVGERAIEKHISSIFSKLELSGELDRHKRVAAVLMFLAASSASIE